MTCCPLFLDEVCRIFFGEDLRKRPIIKEYFLPRKDVVGESHFLFMQFHKKE